MAAADFWNDQESARVDIDRLKVVRSRTDPVGRVQALLDELEATLELAAEDDGEEMVAEARTLLRRTESEIHRLDLQLMFDGPYDHLPCYLSIHAGSGGTESCDWANMLLRMYTRFTELEEYRCKVVDEVPDDDSGGMKSVLLEIEGDNAYGLLKAEMGVHRLVRISPFDAAKRRHTSFASVDVTPLIPDDAELEIDEGELRIDTYRAGGAGGQHVNKTDSAIRITHLPTGIVVQCQNERSQHKNRSTAMKMLKAKLLAVKEQEREDELRKLGGEKGDAGFGHQIRSYVFHPYTMVKDHRTGHEVGNIQAVMDGNIRGFLEAWLRKRKN